jgi:hypothetical protein
MKFRAGKVLLAGIACLVMATATYVEAATLRVTVSARGNQRAVWQDAFDQFKKANPDVDLKVTYVGEEAYKVQMSGWLATDPPDVLSWHNGERMAYFANAACSTTCRRLAARRLEPDLRRGQAAFNVRGQAVCGAARLRRVRVLLSQGPVPEGRHCKANQKHGMSFSPTARN